MTRCRLLIVTRVKPLQKPNSESSTSDDLSNVPPMAVFRSLNTLIRSPNSKRLLLTVSASATPFPRLSSILSPLSLSFASRFTYSHSRVLSPLSISIPFRGPLFLSSPPWKLSQSATPLLLQGDVVLRNVEALKLLRNRSFPIRLGGFGSVSAGTGLLGRLDKKQLISGDVGVAYGDFVRSFMNLPNLISFSRLASGPLLAWYVLILCNLRFSGFSFSLFFIDFILFFIFYGAWFRHFLGIQTLV